MSANKVVFIKAPFKAVGREAPVNLPTGETKRGIFGGEKVVTRKELRWEQTGWSDCEVDGEALAEQVSAAIRELNGSGHEIVSATPITSGSYAFKEISSSARLLRDTEAIEGGGYGYGFSYTEGILLLARKINA